MKEIIVLICFAILLGSCKKFEHKEVKELPECTYCHLADSIEGSYTGRLVERTFGPNAGCPALCYDTILDTIITVDITRTYEGLNEYEDSIIFKFNCSYFHDDIYLSESSIQTGKFTPYGSYDLQKFTEDKRMLVSRIGYLYTSETSYYDYVALEFEGFKDE